MSADVAITIEEDGSYTITQEELLQFATDIEDDDMTAIIGEQGDDTTVTGTVLDAESSNPVSGAEVTLTDGAGNSYTTVTDDSGNYSVSGSIVNEGTVTIEQEGSITTSFVVPAGEETNGGVTAISEVLDDADMRVVVTWGDDPRDLDNHLWLYDQDSGQELDHIYYRDMSYNQGGGDRVTQDVDDVNGNGPETITIPNYEDMNMHYSVHNYSGRSWDVDGVEEVQVQIFVGDTLIQSFTPDLPDNPQGDHWHVFDIIDGVIVPSQDVSTESNFELPTSEEAASARMALTSQKSSQVMRKSQALAKKLTVMNQASVISLLRTRSSQTMAMVPIPLLRKKTLTVSSQSAITLTTEMVALPQQNWMLQ